MNTLLSTIRQAAADGKLLSESAKNIESLLSKSASPVDQASVAELVRQKKIEYIPFPEALKGKYQSHTQADLTRLRAAGYKAKFLNVQEGVSRYVNARLAAT